MGAPARLVRLLGDKEVSRLRQAAPTCVQRADLFKPKLQNVG
jgi:hypothetical protein